MRDVLLKYYERELTYFRKLGGEFAEKYPKIAARLLLEGDKCEDPHVERLIQAFAFMAGRIHKKLDDDFPEITEALIGMLYPELLAPIPSMCIVQLVLSANPGQLTKGFLIERGSTLYSQPVSGSPCYFRTCYPVTLWPFELRAASISLPDPGTHRQAVSVITMQLECLGGTTFSEVECDSLRVYLDGEGHHIYPLYEMFFNNLLEVRVVEKRKGANARMATLPTSAVTPVGFSLDEGLFPYADRSFSGYRLFQEYFTFPQKFLFFDLAGLNALREGAFGQHVELQFVFNRSLRLDQAITAATFRLGCTPIVNLFKRIAEPIRLTHAQTEYPLIVDVRRPNATEVYSVDEVSMAVPDDSQPVRFHPFFSYRHSGEANDPQAFWHAVRRPSPRKGDNGTEIFLCLVDLNFQPTNPPDDTLMVQVTCTNRDLPAKLPFGGDRADFELEAAAPTSKIRCLTKPTDALRLPFGHGLQWRLISHLSLNYLSLGKDAAAIRELLAIYNFSESPATKQQIDGITGLRTDYVVRRVSQGPWNGCLRGLQVNVDFNEEKFVGSGVYLLAAVLERFFSLYVSVNSFTEMVATSQQRKEPVHLWPPRTGDQVLL